MKFNTIFLKLYYYTDSFKLRKEFEYTSEQVSIDIGVMCKVHADTINFITIENITLEVM